MRLKRKSSTRTRSVGAPCPTYLPAYLVSSILCFSLFSRSVAYLLPSPTLGAANSRLQAPFCFSVLQRYLESTRGRRNLCVSPSTYVQISRFFPSDTLILYWCAPFLAFFSLIFPLALFPACPAQPGSWQEAGRKYYVIQLSFNRSSKTHQYHFFLSLRFLIPMPVALLCLLLGKAMG